MSPRPAGSARQDRRFPRVSGDEPKVVTRLSPPSMFPRVSGDEPSVIMTGIARAFVFPA